MGTAARQIAMERWFGPEDTAVARLQSYARRVCEAPPEEVQGVAREIAQDVFRDPTVFAEVGDMMRLLPPQPADISTDAVRSLRRTSRMFNQLPAATQRVGLPRTPREAALLTKANDLALCALGIMATMLAVGAHGPTIPIDQFEILIERAETAVTAAWANFLGIIEERENPPELPSDEPLTFLEA